jgi:hypothetical protein
MELLLRAAYYDNGDKTLILLFIIHHCYFLGEAQIHSTNLALFLLKLRSRHAGWWIRNGGIPLLAGGDGDVADFKSRRWRDDLGGV